MSKEEEFHCRSCNTTTKKPKLKGSGWIELLLWSVYIIPGLVYSIWRRKNKADVCPNCQKPALDLIK